MKAKTSITKEARRLADDAARTANWKRWGPYLAERQWATVREDYSANGDSWRSFPHDHARSRAYRWGEDGLLGLTDREGRLCFALALWNGRDPILKERLFGLTGPEGNHGEDVKEEYFYLDSTPTHSYMKALYRYPQAEFPYARLVEENRRRGLNAPEFELADTGVFAGNRWFDVAVEYAKASPDDVLIRIRVHNRGPEAAVLHLLPTVWFRNTWSWGCRHEGCSLKPRIAQAAPNRLALDHETLGEFTFAFGPGPDGALPPVLFTENETNNEKLFGSPNASPYVKDAFHRAVVDGETAAVNSRPHGTKAAPHYVLSIPAGEARSVQLRLAGGQDAPAAVVGAGFDGVLDARKQEADAFYEAILPARQTPEARAVSRQAYAGLLFLREWYMHPNGQLPAYEFEFGDVKTPVHAWAAWRVYKIAAPRGKRDRDFLERTFEKLLLNFTWWVNRKDRDGRNLFSGGFLGLDNIGVFDRSKPLPIGGTLQQADGTAWMAFFSLTMMAMAMELVHDRGELRVAYGDMASKFFEHFIQISDAMNALGGTGLWDEEDGFYYDQIHVDGSPPVCLKVRSMVGLLPLIAVTVIEQETLDLLPGFKKRFEWFLKNRPELARHISQTESGGPPGHHHWLLAIPSKERLVRVLRYLLDEEEFLSPHGLRSLSKVHRDHPYVFRAGGEEFRVEYVPGEGNSYLFGGNSNWRGPVWFPVNYLIIEALERYHHFYGDAFKVECPTGSGQLCTLQEVAAELSRRLASIFLPDAAGWRPFRGPHPAGPDEAADRDLVLFHEYFDGETGRGLGASHQTGWTALVTRCLEPTGGKHKNGISPKQIRKET